MPMVEIGQCGLVKKSRECGMPRIATRVSIEFPTLKDEAMSTVIAADLSNTVVARWLRRLAERETPKRSHLRTKTMYWRALAALVAQGSARPLSWRDIVAAAQPRGARSTFYEVAGAHARHRMIDDLIADSQPDSVQLALRYQRSDAVAQLLDEAKVWSYWPYRKQMVDRLTAERQSEAIAQEAVVETVVAWAANNPRLAVELDHVPPACAVEDLTVLAQGRLAVFRAADLLTTQLRGHDSKVSRTYVLAVGPSVRTRGN